NKAAVPSSRLSDWSLSFERGQLAGECSIAVSQQTQLVAAALDLEALLHRHGFALRPAELVLSRAPGTVDLLTHVEAGEGPVAAKLVGVVRTVGQFVIDEHVAEVCPAHVLPRNSARTEA